MRDLPPTNFSVHVYMAVAWSSSGRVPKSQGEWAILGVVRAIQKHWQSSLQPSLPYSLQKGITQSPITSCSRRDHSVCQVSANSNPKNSERRWCGLSAGKGWWECTARAKSDIYDCLVFISCGQMTSKSPNWCHWQARSVTN